MAKVFNPPPNWPAPPVGWTPPSGWQPHPSWGEPPAGWELWVESSQIDQRRTASTEPPAGSQADYGITPEPEQKKGRFGLYAPFITLGAIALSGAMVAYAFVGGGVSDFTPAIPERAENVATGQVAPVSFDDVYLEAVPLDISPMPEARFRQENFVKADPVELTGEGEQTLTFEKPGGNDQPVWVEYELVAADSSEPEAVFSGGSSEQNINVNQTGTDQKVPVKGSIWLDAHVAEPSNTVEIKTTGTWKITLHSAADAPSYSYFNRAEVDGNQIIGSGTQAFFYDSGYIGTKAELVYTPQEGAAEEKMQEFSIQSSNKFGFKDAGDTLVYRAQPRSTEIDVTMDQEERLVTVNGEGYDWFIQFDSSHEDLDIAELNGKEYSLDGGTQLGTGEESNTVKLGSTSPQILKYTTARSSDSANDKGVPLQKFAVTEVNEQGQRSEEPSLKAYGQEGTAYGLVNMNHQNTNTLEVFAERLRSWKVESYPLTSAPKLAVGSKFEGKTGTAPGIYYWPGDSEAKLTFKHNLEWPWEDAPTTAVLYREKADGSFESETIYHSELSQIFTTFTLPAEPVYVELQTPQGFGGQRNVSTWWLQVK